VIDDPREVLVENLPRIERLVSLVCRRHGLRGADAEDFSSEVLLRLVRDDYSILRQFRERSSLTTFLSSVIQRMFLDYRIRLRGKWNPSAEAKRRGYLALDLEARLYRQHQPLDEAVAAVHAAHPEIPVADLRELAESLPPRRPIRQVTLDEVEIGHAPEAVAVEQAETAGVVSQAVRDAIGRLAEEDQLLFRLHYDADMTIAQIAKVLDLPAHQLYQRLHRRLRALRRELEAAGIDAKTVTEIIGTPAPLDFDLSPKSSAVYEREKRP
jgi:RNA polymerase sigma factor (sigma-70 family)